MPRRKNTKLGISWVGMRVGQPIQYDGTWFGLKSQVCRANRIYAPKTFIWRHAKDGTYIVERVS